METRRLRLALAAGGMALGLAGLVGASWAGSADAQSVPSDDTYEVWIIDSGFNPQFCTVLRTDNVRWVNKTSTVRDEMFDHLALPPDLNTPWSTGDLQPGETSVTLSFDFKSNSAYHEKYNPSFTGSVNSVDNGPASCDQFPPTPTPTSTPTATPPGTATPTATPTPPRPDACTGQVGCAMVPAIARDDDE